MDGEGHLLTGTLRVAGTARGCEIELTAFHLAARTRLYATVLDDKEGGPAVSLVPGASLAEALAGALREPSERQGIIDALVAAEPIECRRGAAIVGWDLLERAGLDESERFAVIGVGDHLEVRDEAAWDRERLSDEELERLLFGDGSDGELDGDRAPKPAGGAAPDGRGRGGCGG